MTLGQAEFAAGLLDPDLPAPKGLRDGAGRAAVARYDVYRNNVAVGLSDALETSFPVIRKLVGDTFFRAMAGIYFRAHPPQSPLMMYYGDAMPVFLAGFAPVAHLPYLPDMARLELALRHAYHAADAVPVTPEVLATLSEDARLRFAPSMQLVRSNWPIRAIHLANTTANAPAPVMRPETVLLTRPGFDPALHLLADDAVPVLQALIDGATVGAALETGDGADFGALLTLLVGQQTIVALF
jgi:hypothetical protein